MRPEQLYDLTWVSDPRLSPDGQTVAFVVNRLDRETNEYAGAIWLAATDGSTPAVPFTSGERLDRDPRWSPDGTHLAFVSNRGGGECKKQLYVIPATGGEARKLTDLDEDVTEPVWSPDGARIAFTARVRDKAYEEEDEKARAPRRFTRLQYKHDEFGWTGDRRRHVFAVPADGSEPPKQLTDGDFEDLSPTWAPDGMEIAFTSDRDEYWDTELYRDVYVVDASGGEPRRLTGRDSEYMAPSWSPDGRSIACRWSPGGFDVPRHDRIALVDVETGERRVLTQSLDLHCGPYPPVREPVWAGGSILFAVEERGNTHVYRVLADGSNEPELVVGGEQWVHGFDTVGGTLVHATSTPTRPAELFCSDRRLTSVAEGFVASASLSVPERFTAVSADGTEVDAWVMRPAGFVPGRRYPVLLNIHGGPFTQYGSKFFDEFQVYTGAGYVVLYSNPRGSSGYSEQWGRAIRGPIDDGPGWGTVDYEDVIGVVDEALRRFDFCDGDRLGVMGGSYGGFMTSWIVGHTNRFRAACSERAVNNLLSMFGSSDIGWFERAYIGAWPWEDVQVYLDKSPSTYAENISTPLLIVHSERDLRCHIEQGEHLFTILRMLRREVEFVRFTDESHELTRSGSPRHRVMRFELLLDWFARHLEPERRLQSAGGSVGG